VLGAKHRLDTPDLLAVVEIGHDEVDLAARLAGEALRQRLEALAWRATRVRS